MTAPAAPVHVMGVRQAPGWWPALVQAVCECGWRGPVRDMNNARERVLIRLDKREHSQPAEVVPR